MGLDYYVLMKHPHRALLVLAITLGACTPMAQTPVAPPPAPVQAPAAPTPVETPAQIPVQTPIQMPAAAPSAPAPAPAPEPAAAATSSTTAPAAAATPSRMTARLLYELLLGEFALQQGDAATGAAYVLNAARRTGDESLFKRATEIALQSRSGPATLEATRAWRQAHPDSIEASRYELQVLIGLGRVADTEEPLRALLGALPPEEQLSFVIAMPALYQRVPDKPLAAATVERALSEATRRSDLAPAAWTTIGRMRLQTGDKAGALAAATLGQDANASSEWPALLALQLMASAGEPQAEALLQRHLASPQATPEVRIGYARALVEAGRNADAHRQLDELLRLQPDYPDGWLVKGALLADERRDAEAEAALQRFLALVQAQADQPGAKRELGRGQALLMLARLAERRRDYDGAESLLAQVSSPEQALTVQTQRARMLAQQGQLDAARAAIQATPELRPDDARLKLLAEAQLLRDHQQAEAAYQLLLTELQKTPDDEGLLYDTAMAAERAERLDEMERLLRLIIEINPSAHHAYNALGYALADRGLRLAEARTLIERAIELSPDDSYIQDSLGWVEYRQGRHQEARRILEAAYQARPDAEIAAHLGEVLWVLGEHDAARQAWRDGLRLDAENETLIKTLKRLQVNP